MIPCSWWTPFHSWFASRGGFACELWPRVECWPAKTTDWTMNAPFDPMIGEIDTSWNSGGGWSQSLVVISADKERFRSSEKLPRVESGDVRLHGHSFRKSRPRGVPRYSLAGAVR